MPATGDFGWADPPAFVKQATVWAVEEWLRDPTGESGPLSGESIADFAQSWAVPRGGQQPAEVFSSLPERVREALDPIAREAL